ncbi:MAG: hypothetical protein QM784_18230 [Polyangiaceae bacterium]
MLPPFIIEQIRRREEAERSRRDRQPRLELPLDAYRPQSPDQEPTSPGDRTERGVVILELLAVD